MKRFKIFGITALILSSLIASPFINLTVYAQENSQETVSSTILNNVVSGGPGDDIIIGDVGNDELSGGDGDDIIYGDAGNDKILGDAGNDISVYSSASDKSTIQIGSNANNELRLKVETNDGKDDLTNVENLYFLEDRENISGFQYVPVNGYLMPDSLQRNYGGTYTANWGYVNDNVYEAFNDSNYFEDGSGILDNRSMIFKKGQNDSAITTTITGLVQTWVIGNNRFIADATDLENLYQSQQIEGWQMYNINLYSKYSEYIRDLVDREILEDTLFTHNSFTANMTVGEFINLLTRAKGFDPKQLPKMEYGKYDMITKEQLTVMTLTAFKFQPINNGEFIYEDDIRISDYAKVYTYTARQHGIITETDSQNFNPDSYITRYDAYKILFLYLKLNK